MSLSHDAILEALQAVPEPCSIAMRSEMDIVEMGLIGEVEVDGGRITVELVLTDPACPHFGSLRRYITDVLLELDGVETVEVTHTTTTLWTPDRIRRRRAAA